MNVTSTLHGKIISDIRIAREAGYDGIELQTPKLSRYLDASFRAESLLPRLQGLTVAGVGAVLGAERDREGRATFLAEADRLSATAAVLGAPIVQVCTRPVSLDVVKDFRAAAWPPGALPENSGRAECRSRHCGRAQRARRGRHRRRLWRGTVPRAGGPVQREPPRPRAPRHRAGGPGQRHHVRRLLHFWTTGDTLDEVATLQREVIGMVHVCDGLELDRERDVPVQTIHRDVVPGGGSIPLQEWVDAVKSTDTPAGGRPRCSPPRARRVIRSSSRGRCAGSWTTSFPDLVRKPGRRPSFCVRSSSERGGE